MNFTTIAYLWMTKKLSIAKRNWRVHLQKRINIVLKMNKPAPVQIAFVFIAHEPLSPN